MKKYFEIFLVIFVGFYILYFLLYKFYFGNLCGGYSYSDKLSSGEYVGKVASCKDSFVCNLENIEVNKKNEVTGWECSVKSKEIFELDYYINGGKEYLDSSKNYINGLLGNGQN